MPKRKTQEEIILSIKKIHGDDISIGDDFIYTGMNDKVIVSCEIHKLKYSTTPNILIHQKSGCRQCGLDKLGNMHRSKKDEIIQKCKDRHGDKYDYSKVEVINNVHERITIICHREDSNGNEHGEFAQKAYSHYNTQARGCPKCANDKTSERMKIYGVENISKYNTAHSKQASEEFYKWIEDNKNSYPDFDFSETIYVDSIFIRPIVFCKIHKCHFPVYPNRAFKDKIFCPECPKPAGYSLIEKRLYESLTTETDLVFQENLRSIISPFEIDIVCKEKNLAIEVDGFYWHSDDFKEPEYHLKKTELANSVGYDMIHIFDFELYNKFDIAVSLIKSKLGKSPIKIYARKCIIKEVEYNEALKFINESHMQGAHAATVGTKRFGLYYNDELVSIMTFGKPRYDKNHDWEMMRFCSMLNTSVVGAASKLLSYALKHGVLNIISYANRRWSNGNVYEKLGFTQIRRTAPNYFYVKGNKVLSRISAQKNKLGVLLGDCFNEELTEKENMKNNGWKVLYDCGNIVYSLK